MTHPALPLRRASDLASRPLEREADRYHVGERDAPSVAIEPTHATRQRPGASSVPDVGLVAEHPLVVPSATEERSDPPLQKISAHARLSRMAILTWLAQERHHADVIALDASAA